MSDGTKIEWAANADGTPGASWNPIRARNRETGAVGWFCSHKSPGCELCYAERFNERLGTGVAFKAQNLNQVEIFLDADTLTRPLRWKKPRTIFVCSMSDLFGEFVQDAEIDQVMRVIASPTASQHTFIVLTKRSDRARAYFSRRKPLPNVWLGVSVEDQRRANERIPDLLATPAAIRFLSVEPLIAPIDLTSIPRKGSEGVARPLDGRFNTIDWVIVGGESGAKARPMHPDWARTIRDECAAARVPFFFKQWGEWEPHQLAKADWNGEQPVAWTKGRFGAHPWPDHSALSVVMRRVGKRAAGRTLDGRTHDARPALACEAQP